MKYQVWKLKETLMWNDKKNEPELDPPVEDKVHLELIDVVEESDEEKARQALFDVITEDMKEDYKSPFSIYDEGSSIAAIENLKKLCGETFDMVMSAYGYSINHSKDMLVYYGIREVRNINIERK